MDIPLRFSTSNDAERLRHAASMFVAAGRCNGVAEEVSALRERLSALLDRVTETFPTSAAEATLEQWRDGRRVLFIAIQREIDVLGGRLRLAEQLASQHRAEAVRTFDGLSGGRPLAERVGVAIAAAVRAWRGTR